jgi:hypothetical protein
LSCAFAAASASSFSRSSILSFCILDWLAACNSQRCQNPHLQRVLRKCWHL